MAFDDEVLAAAAREREAALRLGALSVGVRATHVTDPTEARWVSQLYSEKYGSYVKPTKADEPLTKGEGATFELTPAT